MAGGEGALHTLVSAIDRVHWGLDTSKQPQRMEGEGLRKYQEERKKGAGLGVPFAVETPWDWVQCAHGGTGHLQS